jgi:hypothetical protein
MDVEEGGPRSPSSLGLRCWLPTAAPVPRTCLHIRYLMMSAAAPSLPSLAIMATVLASGLGTAYLGPRYFMKNSEPGWWLVFGGRW